MRNDDGDGGGLGGTEGRNRCMANRRIVKGNIYIENFMYQDHDAT